jgi:hypothetical protein
MACSFHKTGFAVDLGNDAIGSIGGNANRGTWAVATDRQSLVANLQPVLAMLNG